MKMRCFRVGVAGFLFWFGLIPANAVTLDRLLQRTLDQNPAILEAKANVEKASGQRLVLESIVWPNVRLGAPAGAQGGKRAGDNSSVFAFARGALTQRLYDVEIPPTLRLANVDLLIAEQRLNAATVEQLHAARLAFYSALYHRALLSLRQNQQGRLEENVASQKERLDAGLIDRGVLTGATVEARELDPQIAGTRRSYATAQLKMAEAMGLNLGVNGVLPEPEGELEFAPISHNLESETRGALERRVDLKLARLLVRAASEEQRIIEAEYYPEVSGFITGLYIPGGAVHREGSTRRADDFVSSEIKEGLSHTWHVIDNGRVTGAVRSKRAAREINEVTLKKMESSVSRELSRIHNNLESIAARRGSLASATEAAEESTRMVAENLAGGLASQLEYRFTQSGSLETRSGLLNANYDYAVAQAEWERATGRYFQFSEDTVQNVH